MATAAPPPPTEDEPESFFALLMAGTHEPYRLPPTVVEYEDADGPYRVRLAVALEAPDDEQVAALDDCDSALDELAVLADDQFEDLLDVLEELDRPPSQVAEQVLEHFGLDQPPEAGWVDLVERINLYGRGLEHDLWLLHYDLGDWFRGRWSFDHLLRQASRLPPGSHYKAAIQSDDELAARIAEVHGPPSKRPRSTRPRLEGFTTEVSYLHAIRNSLGFIGWAVLAAQAKKRGSPPTPQKGPETADDRFEFADYLREHEDVVSRVLVDAPASGPPERQPAPEAVRGAVLLGEPDGPAQR